VSVRVASSELVERIATGEAAAMARLMSRAEAGTPEARAALAEVYRRAGRAHVIGITGVPGSGKSTLVATMAQRLRSSGRKVAIVAIDPSSPFSGGSILGDRIRMADLANDAGVFIRSMATRGNVGGMARATLEVVDVLDVGGFDTIIIETVGVGQDEVEIVSASNTTIVVSAPGLGDEIQAIKAGILEIADIHVISKADRSDANRTMTDLKQMLTLGAMLKKSGWTPPIVAVSSLQGQGFDELLAAIARHRAVVFESEAGAERLLAIADFRLRKIAESLLLERFEKSSTGVRPALARRLLDRRSDPYSLANEMVAKLSQELESR
jgi:LAO/AO transport system kinase